MAIGLSRRQALRGLAAGAAATTVDVPSARAGTPATQPAPAAQPAGQCVLFPQAVEGPYYFDPKLVRADIAEGRPGAPLKLVLKVIESGPCTPIAGSRVDVWHADAGGVYSGYAGQGDTRNVSTKGETYLRGTQTTDASGSASFLTVFPGWYPGRTPHIHVKAFLDAKTVLTGQMYFPEELFARVYRERAPYSSRPVADTTNGTDFLFKSGEREGGGILFAVKEEADLIVASLVIAVDRSGEAAAKSGGWRGMLRGLFGGR
ncbi:MAG: intradiol ring-cleavage dioxygenase [Hyphomicrobium sp.]